MNVELKPRPTSFVAPASANDNAEQTSLGHEHIGHIVRRKGVTSMSWVGVRYRKIALPEIMNTMRIWLDQKQFQPKGFECVISGSKTLVRVQFSEYTEAADFAEAFGGIVSKNRPSTEGEEGRTERSESHGS